jgi:hypothetical protein
VKAVDEIEGERYENDQQDVGDHFSCS